MFWSILLIICLGVLFFAPVIATYLRFRRITHLIRNKVSGDKTYKSKPTDLISVSTIWVLSVAGSIPASMLFEVSVFASILIIVVGTLILYVVELLLIAFIWWHLDWNLEYKLKQKIRGINKSTVKDANTMVYFGDFLLDSGDLDEAKTWYKVAIAQGHKDAQSKLDECTKKIAQSEKRGTEREVEEKARPTCKQCGRKYDPYYEWARPPFCSANCRAHHNAYNS